MKLYCVRHGHAVDAYENAERPLSSRGQEEIGRLAQHLSKQAIHVSHLIHSPRLRARQTAEILAEALKPITVTEAKTGLDENDSVETLAADIQHWQDDTVLVGHMPFISRLVSELMMEVSYQHLVDFVPGTIVCLENYGDKIWLIKWVMTPELVQANNANTGT